MRDRIPTHAGRIKLTPVDAANGIYDIVRADEPVDEGTPINKRTMLTDETAVGLGIEQADPTVNDAFSRIITAFSEVYNTINEIDMPKIETGYYIGTGDNYVDEEYWNTLTFSFKPKFFAIYARAALSNRDISNMTSLGVNPSFFPWGADGDGVWTDAIYDISAASETSKNETLYLGSIWVAFNGNTVTWHARPASTDATDNQFNHSETAYFYFAIG